MTGEHEEPWLELTDQEIAALAPFTLVCTDLDANAVRQVRRTWREMVFRSFFAFMTELDRMPNDREAEMLARAIVAHINGVTIPTLGGRGGATLQ